MSELVSSDLRTGTRISRGTTTVLLQNGHFTLVAPSGGMGSVAPQEGQLKLVSLDMVVFDVG